MNEEQLREQINVIRAAAKADGEAPVESMCEIIIGVFSLMSRATLALEKISDRIEEMDL